MKANSTSFSAVSLLRQYTKRIEKSPLGYRLAKGAFWSFAGAVIARGLGLASSFFVARLLGKEVYGELGILQSTVGMFQVFAGFGLGLTATKYVSEFRVSNADKAGRIICLSEIVAAATGLIASGFLYVFAPWLAAHTLAAPHLDGFLRIGAILILLGAVNGAQTGTLAGFEAFRAIARINLIVGLASFPLMLAGAYFYKLEGVVWGLVGSMGLNWYLNYAATKIQARQNGIPLKFSQGWSEWRILLKFSLPTVLQSMMIGPVMWVCNTILVNQANGYSEMGIFNAANQWRTAVLFLPGAVGSIVLPVLSHLQGQNDHNRYKKVILYNLYLNGGISFLIASLISISASIIMSTYGPGFSGGSMVLIISVYSAVLVAINHVVGQAIASEGKMWWGFLFNILWALSLFAGAYYLIPLFGAKGLAIAFFIAYLLHSIWQALYLKEIIKSRSVS